MKLPESLKQDPIVEALESRAPGSLLAGKFDRGELTIEVAAEQITAVCRILKDELQFVRLSGITAVDRYPNEPRFEVVYHLHSLERNARLRLKCPLGGEGPEIDSVTGSWRAADWYEREVFDLFGVAFRNHPNLQRILMPADWEGHPLRKDYPVHGYRYSYLNE
ncbi:MAG: NADH-quinone oxidoreductase subunit C [Bryobacteraceae bacterium]